MQGYQNYQSIDLTRDLCFIVVPVTHARLESIYLLCVYAPAFVLVQQRFTTRLYLLRHLGLLIEFSFELLVDVVASSAFIVPTNLPTSCLLTILNRVWFSVYRNISTPQGQTAEA